MIRDAIWSIRKRARSFAIEKGLRGLSWVSKLHPAANPDRHGVEVFRDIRYGEDKTWHSLDVWRPEHLDIENGLGNVLAVARDRAERSVWNVICRHEPT